MRARLLLRKESLKRDVEWTPGTPLEILGQSRDLFTMKWPYLGIYSSSFPGERDTWHFDFALFK